MILNDELKFRELANEGKGYKELAEYFGVTTRTIRNWKNALGVAICHRPAYRKYFFNEKYFDNIDCEEKAYFLGLIMADGFVSDKSLGIALKSEDGYILERLATTLGMDGYSLGNKKNGAQKTIYICSKYLVNSLENHGVTKNKTFTLKFPKISEPYMRHFLRGYFDGDGYIGKRHFNVIISSDDFLSEFLSVYQKREGKLPYIQRMSNSYSVYFYKKDASFIQWLYKDNSISLTRKNNNFVEYWESL